MALIQDGTVIQRIPGHLSLPLNVPTMQPAREPPLPFDAYDEHVSGADY